LILRGATFKAVRGGKVAAWYRKKQSIKGEGRQKKRQNRPTLQTRKKKKEKKRGTNQTLGGGVGQKGAHVGK